MTDIRLRFAELGRDAAHRIAGALTELAEPPPHAVSVYEVEPNWQVDAYFGEAPDRPDDISEFANQILSFANLENQTIGWNQEDVPNENWVALSQAALPPVEAGRFFVHGGHDRHKRLRGRWTIEIDAGEAFGTAHHATTYGCLRTLHRLGDRSAPQTVLDLGTGSGVLAIAAKRMWPRASILASDLDADAVRVATQNFAKNNASQIRCVSCDGVPTGKQGAPEQFDLIIANILAGPLAEMSKSVARRIRPGGRLVLSGILNHQAARVQAAYHRHGLALIHHERIEGWSTLLMQKRQTRARPTPPLVVLD